MAFNVTRTVAPVSAITAIHIPVIPSAVVTRKMAFKPRARTTLVFTLRSVARERSISSAMPVTRFLSKAASAVSNATSVPPPIAIPTSAAASAGASLMPSPTLPMGPRPAACQSRTYAALSSGISSPYASMPKRPPVAATVRALSPLSMTACTPKRDSAARPSMASSRGSSRTAIKPSKRSPSTRRARLLPASSNATIRALRLSSRMTFS